MAETQSTAWCLCEGGCEREAEPRRSLCRTCEVAGCEPVSVAASTVTQYALRHGNGQVDALQTATTFGPMEDLAMARIVLETAESDCLCSDKPGAHALVTRTVTTSPWVDL